MLNPCSCYNPLGSVFVFWIGRKITGGWIKGIIIAENKRIVCRQILVSVFDDFASMPDNKKFLEVQFRSINKDYLQANIRGIWWALVDGKLTCFQVWVKVKQLDKA